VSVTIKPVTIEHAYFVCDDCGEEADLRAGDGLPKNWTADYSMDPAGTYCEDCASGHLKEEIRRALGAVIKEWEDADIDVSPGEIEIFIDRGAWGPMKSDLRR